MPPKFQVGDVVNTDFVYQDDPLKKKDRPGLILRVDTQLDGTYVYSTVYMTKRNKSHLHPGKWILRTSKEGMLMKLDYDTFINLAIIIPVPQYAIRRLKGICPCINEILEICKTKNIPF